MSEPIYCGLAFSSVSIGISGEYRPCCGVVPDASIRAKFKSVGTILNKINSEAMTEIRRDLSNGVWNPACQNCKITEKAGAESMRIVWNKSLIDKVPKEILSANDINYLDMSFGSKCNSKCMTCNDSCSDFWQEESDYIWKIKNPIQRKAIVITDEDSEELLNTLPNLSRISFIGGEPTILDEHSNFLKRCVELGINENLEISYVTNLSGVSDELIDLWKKFKHVHLSLSIDGVDHVNDYIRYPIKFSKVKTSLSRLIELSNESAGKKISFGLSCTVSMFNINHVSDTLEFFIDLTRDQLVLAPGLHKPSVFLNKVTFPNYLRSDTLTLEYRKQGLEKLSKLRKKVESIHRHTISPTVTSSLDYLFGMLNEPQIMDPSLVLTAIYFIEQSDKFRNRNIDDYIPGLLAELKSYLQS
jgi:MoaA/NifB/PqqE/SkfB family radical SAM enzyme